MLAVINYDKGNVDILDTDDDVVERVRYDDAIRLRVPISGLTSSVGLCRGLRYKNNGRDFHYVRVYWAEYVASTFDSTIRDQVSYFDSYNIVYKVICNTAVQFVIGKLLYSLIMMTAHSGTPITFYFMDKSIDFDINDTESYLILCLYVLKYNLDSSLKILCGDVDVTFDFNLIRRKSEVFTRGRFTYFCDDSCVLKVRTSVLNSIESLTDRLKVKTKTALLKNTDLGLLTDECVIDTSREYKLLTMDKAVTYIINGNLSVVNLKITNSKAKLKVDPECKLNISNVYIKHRHKVIAKTLNNHLSVSGLNSYSVTSNLIPSDSFLSQLISFNVCFSIIDLNSSDDAVGFVIKLIGDDDLAIIKSGGIISELAMKRINFIKSSNVIKYLPDEYINLLNLEGYVKLNSYDLGVRARQKYPWFLHDCAKYAGYKYSDKIHNTCCPSNMRDSVYDEILDVINKEYLDCKAVADVTGLEMEISEITGMYVPYMFDSINFDVYVTSIEEYEKFKKINNSISYIINEIKSKLDVNTVLEPYKCNPDYFSVVIKGFKRGRFYVKDIPVSEVKRICDKSGVAYSLKLPKGMV